MERTQVIAALHEGTGISVAELEKICLELEEGEHVCGSASGWDAQDTAVAYLRAMVPHMPLEFFISGIADAKLTAAIILQDDFCGRTIFGGQLEANAYTSKHCFSSFAEALGWHIEAVASGGADKSDYTNLTGATVYERASGPLGTATLDFKGAGFKRPATVTLIFGDNNEAPNGPLGRTISLPGPALTLLGNALRASRGETRLPKHTPAARPAFVGGQTLH